MDGRIVRKAGRHTQPRQVAQRCTKGFNYHSCQCFSNYLKYFRLTALPQLCKQHSIRWANFDHPNVLPLTGIIRQFGRHGIALVSPWMNNGDVLRYVKTYPDVDRKRIIRRIAEGLRVLHTYDPPIVHGDLKAVRVHSTLPQQLSMTILNRQTFTSTTMEILSSLTLDCQR